MFSPFNPPKQPISIPFFFLYYTLRRFASTLPKVKYVFFSDRFRSLSLSLIWKYIKTRLRKPSFWSSVRPHADLQNHPFRHEQQN